MSLSSFGITAPFLEINIPPSTIEEEYVEGNTNSQENSFYIDLTQYVSFDKSLYSFRLGITECAIEVNDKNTVENLDVEPNAVTKEINIDPITSGNRMNINNSFATLQYVVEAVPFFDGQNMLVEYFI